MIADNAPKFTTKTPDGLTVYAHDEIPLGIFVSVVGHNQAVGDLTAKLTEAQADLAAANTVIARMREAGNVFLREAVWLSADYLETFRDWPMDKTIQGWDKARWIRALAAAGALGDALSLTPATVRDEVAELKAELAALRTRAEKAEAERDQAKQDAWTLDRCEDGSWGIRQRGGEWAYLAIDEDSWHIARRLDAARQPTPQPHEEGKR